MGTSMYLHTELAVARKTFCHLWLPFPLTQGPGHSDVRLSPPAWTIANRPACRWGEHIMVAPSSLHGLSMCPCFQLQGLLLTLEVLKRLELGFSELGLDPASSRPWDFRNVQLWL